MELPAVVDSIFAITAYATIGIRRYVHLHRRWDVLSVVLGLFGATAAVAVNADSTVGWAETALAAVLLALLPFALISFLVTINLALWWVVERIVDRQAAKHGADDPCTRQLRSLRDTADNSWRRWMGPR